MAQKFKDHKLKITLSWAKFARLLIIKDKKKTNYKALFLWKKLIFAAESKGHIKLKGLHDVGLGEVIQQLGVSQEKKKKMDVLGRWNILTRGILRSQGSGVFDAMASTLQTEEGGKKSKAIERWTHIIKTIAINYDYFQLKTFLNLDKKAILKKLNIKNAKVNRLAIQGRWNMLIKKISTKQMKA